MGLDLESREAVGYSPSCLRELPSGATSGEGIQESTDDAHRHFSSLRFLLGGHVRDVIDEHEGLAQEFLTGIRQRSQTSRRLQRQRYIDIVGVVLTACLDEFGIEGRAIDTISAQAEPLGYHQLAQLFLVEQVLRELRSRSPYAARPR